jgi:hypothetical protein
MQYEIMATPIWNVTYHRKVYCTVRFDLVGEVIWSHKIQEMQA